MDIIRKNPLLVAKEVDSVIIQKRQKRQKNIERSVQLRDLESTNRIFSYKYLYTIIRIRAYNFLRIYMR